MKILPTPTADEIAAILVAIASATPQPVPAEADAKPSRWRMAGREYASDMPR